MSLPDLCPEVTYADGSISSHCLDDVAWVRAYLTSHSMSPKSRIYGFIFWGIIGVIAFALSLAHLLHLHGGVFGAYWNVVVLGRKRVPRFLSRTYARMKCQRPEKSQPTYLPSNGRILGILLFCTIVLTLAFVGPDYLPPAEDPGQPTEIIQKSWWTSSGRTGIMVFALFPLCILFGLKGSPFALFSLKFTMQLHFDKLAWLHRWTAGLIWLLTACHVGLWTTQLSLDKYPGSGDFVLAHVWRYPPFICGWTAFLLLTLLILTSFKVVRNNHYEVFYALHILLVPAMLLFAGFHHPSIWVWTWCALALWVGERLWRMGRYLHTNHVSGRRGERRSEGSLATDAPLLSAPFTGQRPSEFGVMKRKVHTRYYPPPGFAHAEIVAGTTVRVTYVLPCDRDWAPGQYFLIHIPSVSMLTTHPFTSASVYAGPNVPPTLVFFIRVKNGFTRELWNRVIQLCLIGLKHPSNEVPPPQTKFPESGVLLRMNIDGPFGSAGRVRWPSYSSAVIVVGGSGVSYGLSILEHLCRLIAQRKERAEEGEWGPMGSGIVRVKFVWVIREYGHLQWAASTLRRCMEMGTPSEIEISIFVTHPGSQKRVGPMTELEHEPLDLGDEETFAPPVPRFSEQNCSRDSIAPEGGRGSTDNLGRGAPSPQEDADIETGELEELGIGDLVTFDGDEDVELPGERRLNTCLRRESRVRRARSKGRLLNGKHRKRRSDTANANSSDLGERETLRSGPVKIGQDSKPDPCPPNPGSIVADEGDSQHPSRRQKSLSRLGSASHLGYELEPVRPVVISVKPSSFHNRDDTMRSFQSTGAPEDFSAPFAEECAKGHPDGDAVKIDHAPGYHLQMNKNEMHDIMVVSEYARPGRPKMGRIMREEVYAADGPIVVACCGPASLNTLVRESVVAQIDIACSWKEGGRGHISFVSEEFDY